MQKMDAAVDRYCCTMAAQTDPNQRCLVFSTTRSPIYDNNRVGGLADRLKGLICVFYLAVVTERRFFIRWEQPFPLRQNLAPNLYDWTTPKPAQELLNRAAFARHIDLIDKGEVLGNLTPEQIETLLFSGDQFCVVNANNLRLEPIAKRLEAPLTEPLRDRLTTRAFETLFKFVDISEFAKQRSRFADLQKQSDLMVGIHLRTGGGNGWRDPPMDNWENYELVIDRALAVAKDRGARNPGFYFVSDSTPAREEARKRYHELQLLVELEQVAHMDRSTGHDQRANNLAFHEFQMLRSCDILVCGKGGFAHTVAMTAGIPMIRYAPKAQ
jgi:hypothetical protein